MKSVLTLVVLMFLGTGLFAGEDIGDFVQTKEKVYFFKNLRFGISSFLVGTMGNGEKVKFAKEDVIAYNKAGERFEKVSIVIDNVCTENYCFMKVVAYKNGLKLYKHEYNDKNGNLTSRHYVFKDDKFIVKCDRKNLATLTAFFERSYE